MGSVYRNCPDCGESIGGYWNVDVDGSYEENEGTPQADVTDPFNLRLAMIAHRSECLPWKRWEAALEEIAGCNDGKGYMPELAQKALGRTR